MHDGYKTHHYWTYGMKIESSISLPDLISADSGGDVAVGYGEITDSLLNSLLRDAATFERPGCRIKAAAGAMLVEWERVGRFLVFGGRKVIVEPEPDVLEEDLHPFITGPVFSILLHQRGDFVLHASAVAIDGRAALFLGAKGYGKSTLAANLQVRGHQLISDDIVPVRFGDQQISTSYGFPRVKLYEDSITAIGQRPADFPLIHRFVEKRAFRHSEGFSTAPVPLSCVYILSESEEVNLEKPSLPAAFIEVMTFTFLNRYLDALESQSAYFQQCQNLVRTIPVWKLNRPHNFGKLDEICALLENHAFELTGQNEPVAAPLAGSEIEAQPRLG